MYARCVCVCVCVCVSHMMLFFAFACQVMLADKFVINVFR
jgi:hypothetical protein